MSDSETIGRCRQQLEAWYANNPSSVPRYSWMIADAIDRIAADVASIRAKVDAISDVAHLLDSDRAWVKLVEEQRDAAIRERDQWREEARIAAINRDEARAEVERLRAEPEQRQPAGNSPEIPDSSPAAPQPAAPAAGWLTEEERQTLSRAGSPPVVEVPELPSNHYARSEAERYRAAIDKAGVAWKEVGRE